MQGNTDMPTPNCQSQPDKEKTLKKEQILLDFRIEIFFKLIIPRSSTAGFWMTASGFQCTDKPFQGNKLKDEDWELRLW